MAQQSKNITASATVTGQWECSFPHMHVLQDTAAPVPIVEVARGN